MTQTVSTPLWWQPPTLPLLGTHISVLLTGCIKDVILEPTVIDMDYWPHRLISVQDRLYVSLYTEENRYVTEQPNLLFRKVGVRELDRY